MCDGIGIIKAVALAAGAKSSGPPRSVKIVGQVFRQVEIENFANIFDIEATGGEVAGDDEAMLVGADLLVGALALTGAHVTVEHDIILSDAF